MNTLLQHIKEKVYDRCAFKISNLLNESEGKVYAACNFHLNGARIISRNAKITPKKTGQFVTFWKREKDGPIAPFEASDAFDFFVVNISTAHQTGQFVFPKSVLITKGIISDKNKEGKRAFRVYPLWEETQNPQAEKSQQWQKLYFYNVDDALDVDLVKSLYKID